MMEMLGRISRSLENTRLQGATYFLHVAWYVNYFGRIQLTDLQIDQTVLLFFIESFNSHDLSSQNNSHF